MWIANPSCHLDCLLGLGSVDISVMGRGYVHALVAKVLGIVSNPSH